MKTTRLKVRVTVKRNRRRKRRKKLISQRKISGENSRRMRSER